MTLDQLVSRLQSQYGFAFNETGVQTFILALASNPDLYSAFLGMVRVAKNPQSLSQVSHPGITPLIVTLCGSTRFFRLMHQTAERETMRGRIVLVVGNCDQSDDELGITPEQKAKLCLLHRHKIDLCDQVLVVDQGGYIGKHTESEIEYAKSQNKTVRFLSSEIPSLAWSNH